MWLTSHQRLQVSLVFTLPCTFNTWNTFPLQLSRQSTQPIDTWQWRSPPRIATAGKLINWSEIINFVKNHLWATLLSVNDSPESKKQNPLHLVLPPQHKTKPCSTCASCAESWISLTHTIMWLCLYSWCAKNPFTFCGNRPLSWTSIQPGHSVHSACSRMYRQMYLSGCRTNNNHIISRQWRAAHIVT